LTKIHGTFCEETSLMNDRSFVCVKVVFRFSPPIKQIAESCDKTQNIKSKESPKILRI